MAWHALSANPVGLIQAPMAGVQGVELALAVSGAGALGSLPCAMLDAVALKTALAQIRAQGANVNINFFCHQVPPVDDAREARWRAALLPYYRELGLDPLWSGQNATGCKAIAAAELTRELARGLP